MVFLSAYAKVLHLFALFNLPIICFIRTAETKTRIKVNFETPHGIWLLFYEPLPLFQLF